MQNQEALILEYHRVDGAVVNVTFPLEGGVTWVELQEEFDNFLRAVGYVIPYTTE